MTTEIQEQPTILRTPRDGCFEYYTGGWGKYLRPIDDPEANVIINNDDLKTFELKENIHRIPADLWQRWVQLCFYYVDKVAASLEVSVRILRNEEDPSKYRILVPRQEVSGASVRVDSFDEAIDIETGEPITQYPPVGWIPVGSSHSHNTMGAFFSGTDDKYELGDPGIHLVVGSINISKRSYAIASSVVAGGRRFKVNYNHLIDATPVDDVSYHEDVLSYVTVEKPKITTIINTWQGQKQRTNNFLAPSRFNPPTSRNTQSNYKDPFHYQDSVDWTEFESIDDYWNAVESAQKKTVKLWNIEDSITDFLKQNRGDIEEKSNLMTLLTQICSDIEAELELDLMEVN
jgi:hypothetical protein